MRIDDLFIGRMVRDAKWEEGKHPRAKNGQFAKGSGGSGSASNLPNREIGEERQPSENKGHKGRAGRAGGSNQRNLSSGHVAKPVPNKQVNSKEFVPTLDKAKATCPPDKAWRVDTYRKPEDFDAEGIKTYSTAGGSTFAIKPDGDIISVCKNQAADKETNAKDIMAAAVAAGGTHLDSYEGNYEFYVKCGFEVVSRCKFDIQYKPPGWDENRDAWEDVLFMRYVGVGNVRDVDRASMKERIPYSSDYDSAAKVLEDVLKKGRGK